MRDAGRCVRDSRARTIGHGRRLPHALARCGWEGGLGTSRASDPREQLVAILLSECLRTSPSGPQVYRDFWTSVHQAIDD